MNKHFTLLGLSLFSTVVWANDAALKAKLEQLGATNVAIVNSDLPGFKVATSDQGIVHISENGRYVIQGSVLELKDGKVVDITNKVLLTELNALSDEMIVYPAKNEKHVVTVFMDITCHYCHLLHTKVKEYNDLGITLRYLAFPRNGLNGQTARQMEAIWTAEDRAFALNEAENGNPPKTLKEPNIVKKHYQLGQKFGISGTPNLITSEGEVIAGYVEPKALLEMLSE